MALSPGQLQNQAPLIRQRPSDSSHPFHLLLITPREYQAPTAKNGLVLDPPPLMKWAEEGFEVTEWTPAAEDIALEFAHILASSHLKGANKIGVLIYGSALASAFADAPLSEGSGPAIAAVVFAGTRSAPQIPFPSQIHCVSSASAPVPTEPTASAIYVYNTRSDMFILPSRTFHYAPVEAQLAHSRALVFLKDRLGGPHFDLESIWAEHLRYEFGERAVERTMETMVAQPYVNHIPTLTGGIGREALTGFYADHFVFCNPSDTIIEVVGRTVGKDRIVDEMIMTFTHDKTIDWMLPQVAPTGKKVSVAIVGVVCIRGDRLYNEHIYWDQASVLVQIGLLDPDLIPAPGRVGLPELGRMPIAGAETTQKLRDPESVPSNGLILTPPR